MLKVNRRIAAIKLSATLAADARANEMKAAGIDVIPLAAGEPDFDTPERIKEAARRALAAGKTKYCAVTGIRELKEAICLKLRRENGLDYELSEVIASAGSKQAEANLFAAIFDEGDEVIVPTPAWVSFMAMVALSGAEPKLLWCPESDGFLLKPDALRGAITPRTKGIIICSPSNPTGAVYDADRLRAIANVLADTDIWVLSDDAYEHMAYGEFPPHLFKIEPKLKSHGIAFNSLSKTYAMTGWRIGFAAGPKEAIGAAGRLQSQNSGNPNSITQWAAIEALSGPQDELKPMLEAFRKRSALVVERVRRIPGFKLPNMPQGAFYVFPNVSELLGNRFGDKEITDGDGLAAFLLDQAHVSLVGGNDFGAPDHVRISYATSMENLNRAFDRIESAVTKLKR